MSGGGGFLDTLSEAFGAIPTAVAGAFEGEPLGQVAGNLGKSVLETASAGAFNGGGGGWLSSLGDALGLGGGAVGPAAAAGVDATGGLGPAFLGGTESLAAPASGIGGATAAGAADPFATAGAIGLNTGGDVAGGGVPGAVATSAPADVGGSLATFGEPTADATGTGGAVTSSVAAPAAAPATSAPALDTSFGDLSGAFGGTGQFGTPTTDPFATSGGSGVLSGLKSFLKDNKELLGLGGLGASLGKSVLFPSKIPGQDTLTNNAGIAQGIAGQFGTGGLTPQQQAQQSTTLQGQIAAIKSKYASMGLAGSTAEQADIAKAQNDSFASGAGATSANANTALSAVGAANAPTLAIAQQTMHDDDALTKAIAAIAAASLYSPTPTTAQFQ